MQEHMEIWAKEGTALATWTMPITQTKALNEDCMTKQEHMTEIMGIDNNTTETTTMMGENIQVGRMLLRTTAKTVDTMKSDTWINLLMDILTLLHLHLTWKATTNNQ